jgi:hypothetical protein
MAENSIQTLFKGQLPAELVDKVDNVLEQFDSTGALATTEDTLVDDASLVVSATDLTTDVTERLVLESATDATVGEVVQNSPALALKGSAWDTDGVVAKEVAFHTVVEPQSDTDVSGNLSVYSQLDGGSKTRVFYLRSSGEAIASSFVSFKEDVGTDTSNGLVATNATEATVGAQVQNSPALSFQSSGWDVNGAVAVPVVFSAKSVPAAGNDVTGDLVFTSEINEGAPTEVFSVSSAGDIKAVGGFRQNVGPFSLTDAAASQTDAALMYGFSGGAWVAPFAGSIMAIGGTVSEAAAGDDITFKVFKNGVYVTDVAVEFSAGGGTYNYSAFDKDDYAFAAGDRIKITYTTSGTFSATTLDAVLNITVEC